MRIVNKNYPITLSICFRIVVIYKNEENSNVMFSGLKLFALHLALTSTKFL